MADPTPPQLTKETLQRLSREQVGMPVTLAEAERMLALVNDLQAQAALAVQSARAGVEPPTLFALEDWTHD